MEFIEFIEQSTPAEFSSYLLLMLCFDLKFLSVSITGVFLLNKLLRLERSGAVVHVTLLFLDFMKLAS